MSRKLLFVMAIGVILLGPWLNAAQSSEKTVGRGGVGSGYGEPLTRSAAADPTGHVAVYGGLALVGLTLAAVSLQRRSTMQSRLVPHADLADKRRADPHPWPVGRPERVTAAGAPSRRS